VVALRKGDVYRSLRNKQAGRQTCPGFLRLRAFLSGGTTMRRFLVLGFILAFLGMILAPVGAIAQTGTPAAVTGGATGPAVGTTVPYIGQDGAQIGTITVNSISEPFEEFDASSPPQRGYHFALVEVTIANTGTRPFEVTPGGFLAIDNEGFVATQTYVYRGEAPEVADLTYTDALAPGTELTGMVPYEVFGTSAIERVVYSPSYDRLITLVDQRSALAVPGTPVSVIGSTGQEVAQVTVNAVADPFEGFDEFSAPPRGSRYVLLDVTVKNTGGQVLSVAPTDFWVTDDQGFVLQTAFATRVDVSLPDFDYLDLQPGEEQHGAIVYQLLAGIPVVQVSYGDGYTHLAVVADLSAGPAGPAGTPQAEASPAAVISANPECEGLAEWGLDLLERITEAQQLVAPLQTTPEDQLDPAVIQETADKLAEMGEEQRNSNPPPAAEELNTFMADQFYDPMSSALTKIADALESGNAVTAMVARAEAEEVGALFEDGGEFDTQVNAVIAACPEETQGLGS
jgi:Domain of unknown function (DUF4352)